MSEISKGSEHKPREQSWQSGARGTQGQMEGGAAVHTRQMDAPDLIYEINNVSQIEFRNRNTLPEF